ncbi:MAG: hypothetical protein AABW85_06125 [archaeon]
MNKKNQLILLLLNASLFFAGLGIGSLFNIGLSPFSLHAHPAIELVFLSVVFFALSTLFSGLASPIFFLYFGLISSKAIPTNPIGMSLAIIPLAIVSFAGSLTGKFAALDLEEKENLFDHKKEILMLFAAGMTAAVVVGFLAAFFAGIDQTKYFPFLYASN